MPDEAEISAKFIAVFIAVIQRYTDIFNILTPKIVRLKNNKDRECQKATDVNL